MPELPEVQTVASGLHTYLRNQTINKLQVLDKKIVINKKRVEQMVIKKIWRRAKMIVIDLASGQKLVCHLKMTGQLIYVSASGKTSGGGHPIVAKNYSLNIINPHTRAWLEFVGGDKLLFHDTRRFGFLRLCNQDSWQAIDSRHGLEPLAGDYNWTEFNSRLSRRSKTTLKQALLDQTVIVGLGNIYVDEVLFASGILPTRKFASLTDQEKRKLYLNIPKVLAKAVAKGGTTFSDYVTALGKVGGYVKYLQVYGRKNLPCFRCRSKLKATKIGGRTTVYCANCQV